jgi:hypothetical protein
MPPLFAQDGRDIGGVSRRPVAMAELLGVKHDMADQLGI